MRLQQLDALRAFAFGSVMVEHYGGDWLNRHFPIGAGTVGVGCFFTLSGFLITGVLLESFDRAERKSDAFWSFYVRRFFRLMPAFYAVILALVLLGIEPIASSWPWHAAYLTNVWMTFGHPSNVFWSLAVEEQFYLLWPLIIIVAPRRWLPAVTIGLIIGAIAFKFAIWKLGFSVGNSRGLLPANFELLALGCLLGMVCYRRGTANCFDWYAGPIVPVFTAVAWACLGLAVGLWVTLGEGNMPRYFFNNLLIATFFAWLVLQAGVGFKGPVGWVFELPALQYVGRISYGLYLVHNWMPKVVERFAGPLPRLQLGPIVITATFALCMLSWHFFEQPILRLGRAIAGRPPDRGGPPVAPAKEAALG
jgi:peptidoglycan/LPS O-acetylase OafA/YrhL